MWDQIVKIQILGPQGLDFEVAINPRAEKYFLVHIALCGQKVHKELQGQIRPMPPPLLLSAYQGHAFSHCLYDPTFNCVANATANIH